MADLVFQTKKSMEEIDAAFEEFDFFGTLMEALEEALGYARAQRNWVG